jgi:hypothetical protein
MIRKSGHRLSEKIMLKQEAKAGWRFNQIASRFSAVNLKFLPVSPRVHRRNFKFMNRTRIIKLLVLLMFPKFA